MPGEIQDNDYVEEEIASKVAEPTPLPKMQVFIVMIIMLAEPISSTVIYPFVNKFVQETGITKGDETKAGQYAGLLESAFFFAECGTVFYWGRLSDRIGRRPVVLLGPLGLAIALFTFGLSKSFWLLLVARCGQGAFNGNIGVTKSVLAEVHSTAYSKPISLTTPLQITDPSNVGQAYAWLPVMWSAGITFGPLIGGVFAQPAYRWPRLSHIHLLVEHPYFLPCAIAGCLSITSFILSYIGLKETLQTKYSSRQPLGNTSGATATPPDDADVSEDTSLSPRRNSRDYGSNHIPTTTNKNPTQLPESTEISLKTLLSLRTLLIALANHGFVSFLEQAHEAILPLMYSTSVDLGGLGRDPHDIGMIMGIWGALNAVFQVLFFSKILGALGPRKMYTICFGSFLFTFMAFPFMNVFARWSGDMNLLVWVTICLQMTFYSIVFMSYGCTQLFIMNAAPTRNSLGAVNALGQMISSVTRTVAPSFTGSLFSISVQRQLIGGYFVYGVLLVITAAGICVSFLLPRALKGS